MSLKSHHLSQSHLIPCDSHSMALFDNQIADFLHIELGSPFVVSNFESVFHSRSSSPASSYSDKDEFTHEDSKSFQSDSELDSVSDGDVQEAQYITLYPSDQPLYKSLSPAKDPPATTLYPNSVGVDAVEDEEVSIIDSSSSHTDDDGGIPHAFFQELRRIIPGGEDFEFDGSLLDAMDARLLLTPMDVFDELCWVQISQSQPVSMRSVQRCRYSRSEADVPFDMADDCVDVTDAWYERAPQILRPLGRAKSSPCRTSSAYSSQKVYLDAREFFADEYGTYSL